MRETRETATAAMYQAIPRLAGDIAAGASSFHLIKHPVWMITAYVLLKQ